MRLIILFALVFFVTTQSSFADGCDGEIVSNGYAGIYKVMNEDTGLTSAHQGDEPCLMLEPDASYRFIIAPGADINFKTVGGEVECTAGSGLKCRQNVVSLETTTIAVDRGAYRGHWWVQNAENASNAWSRTSNNVTLIKGVTSASRDGGYELTISHGTSFRFNVEYDESVTLNGHHADSATGGVRRLTFRNTTITIDPRTYPGMWTVAGVTVSGENPEYSRGRKSVVVIPGIDRVGAAGGYALAIGHSVGLRFNVSSNGDIWLNQYHSSAAKTDGSNLRLNSTSVRIGPNNHNKSWCVIGAEQSSGGNDPNCAPKLGARAVTVIPGVRDWILTLGAGSQKTSRFDVGATGIPGPLKRKPIDSNGVPRSFKTAP